MSYVMSYERFALERGEERGETKALLRMVQAKFGSPTPEQLQRLGFRDTIAALQDEIRALYTPDEVPWVIGYSGGKDSTATLQLVWSAVEHLPPEQRRKTIHVISTDTLVGFLSSFPRATQLHAHVSA